jgi:hypothetical protein
MSILGWLLFWILIHDQQREEWIMGIEIEGEWLIEPEQVAETLPQEADQTEELPERPSAGTYKGKTGKQWRDLAQVRRLAGRGISARECETCADLADQDGIWTFPALFTLTGGLVAEAVWVKTRMGKWVWRIGTGEATAWFDPSRALSGARRRANDAAKGYQVGSVRARGYVGMKGTGFFIAQVDNSPIEIVDNGTLGTQYTDR